MIRLPPRSTSTANLVPYTTRFRSGRKLSITAGEDGRILLHCFSCGDAAAIVQAAALTIADLFTERMTADTHEDRQRRRRLAREAQWGAELGVVGRRSAEKGTRETDDIAIGARSIYKQNTHYLQHPTETTITLTPRTVKTK